MAERPLSSNSAEQHAAQPQPSRRGFLRTAGGVAAGTALFVAGCDTGGLGASDPPSPDFVFAANGTDPLAITFNATGSKNGEIAFYEWDFGDDASERTQDPEITHAYATGGSYEVTLRVANRAGATAKQTQAVSVGVAPGQTVTLDFNNDFGVLNFAYALEQLEGAFYARVAAALNNGDLSFGDEETADYFRDVTAHETIHRLTLQTVLGANAIPAITPNFSSVDFSDATSVLDTAQVLEDTGVSAYNGAADLLSNPGNLAVAGKIVSVEARHASTIRATIDPGTVNFADLTDSMLMDFGADPNNSYDAAQPPGDVLAAAGGFISTDIQTMGLPS